MLCEQQNRSLNNRLMEEMISKVEDRATMHEQHSHQLEQRLAHVTAMHSTIMSELQAELEALSIIRSLYAQVQED
eukprot:907934-Amphidinium_carterae.1